MPQIKKDPRLFVAWLAIIGVVVYGYVVHRITLEVMMGYFVALGVPSVLQTKRKQGTRERKSDLPSLNTPVTTTDRHLPLPSTATEVPVIAEKESGER